MKAGSTYHMRARAEYSDGTPETDIDQDENAKTASFLFHQILPPSLYNNFAGSTRVLSNTNVEYNLAGLTSGANTYEVTPTQTPQIVWQMIISGTNTYRSFRMPSLYPDVQC